MSNTASIVMLVAQGDVTAIEEICGKADADDEGLFPFCRRLGYHAGPTDIDSALARAIASKVPVVGDITPSNQQPGYAFCAVDGRYLEWPQIHGQPCALMRENRKGRLVVDREDLRLARTFWEQRQQALDTIQQRCYAEYRNRKP